MAANGPSNRDSNPSGPPDALVRAVKRLLRPLVRLLLTYGVQYPFVAEMLKTTYVGIADREFQVEGKPQTQSRVSLLTGVHRKDVKRLIHERGDGDGVPASVSLGVQIAALWLSDPDFVDENGHPRPLPRSAIKGGSQSFEGLVARVSKDIHSRSILDEWLRLGVATVDDDAFVRLKAEAFVPEKGFEEKVYFLGLNVHDHLATAVHNVAGQDPLWLERAVFYDGLSEESVAELAEMCRELGMKALLEVNRRALKLKRRDANHGLGTQRMNYGLYFYRGPKDELH
jgi:Family of unknown function (DUF6502)